MAKKFAFFLFAPGSDGTVDDVPLPEADNDSHLMLIRNFDHALEKAKWCADNGFGVIELCGWFGPERARQLIQHTGGKMGVGYCVHEAGQDAIFDAFFAPPGQ